MHRLNTMHDQPAPDHENIRHGNINKWRVIEEVDRERHVEDYFSPPFPITRPGRQLGCLRSLQLSPPTEQ